MSLYFRFILVVPIALLFAACGGGGGGGSSNLSGVAAVGAPVVGGTVTANCADDKLYTSANLTNANGVWRISNVPSSAPPCALKLSGGTAGGNPVPDLYSYADSTTGDVNITPFTDLIMALAAGDPAAWFDDFGEGDVLDVEAATDTLFEALSDAGYDLSRISNFAPLNASFKPTQGDPYDDLLEALRESTNGDYEDLREQAVNGELVLPEAPATGTPTDPEAPSNITVLTDYAGTYTVSGKGTADPSARGTATRDHARGTIIIHLNGDIDYDTGISFTVGQIVAIYDRKTVAHDRRVAVNYGASDSDERVRVYLDDALSVVEIIHDDGQGGTTRALIGTGGTEPEGPTEPVTELPNDKAGIINMVKSWAGTRQLLSYQSTGSYPATGEDTAYGIRTQLYEFCPTPLGLGTGEQYTDNPQLDPAEAVLTITADGKIRVSNKQDSSKFLEVDPNAPNAVIVRRDENSNIYSTDNLTTFQYDGRDMAGAVYAAGTYFGFYLGVDAEGKLQRVTAGVAGLTPSCNIDFKVLTPAEVAGRTDPMAALKALAGTYTRKHDYRENPVEWTSLTIANDGAMNFGGGAGPSVTAAQIKRVTPLYRPYPSAGQVLTIPPADVELWALRVYVDVHVDDNDAIDHYDYVTLFLDADGNLRDIMYRLVRRTQNNVIARGDVVEVSFVDVTLPSAPDASHKTAINGNGVSGSINGTSYRLDGDTPNFQQTLQSVGGVSFREQAGNIVRATWEINFGSTVGVGPGPLSTDTSYNCITENDSDAPAAQSIMVNLSSTPVSSFGVATDFASNPGGRCEITLDSFDQRANGIVDAAAGSFRAILFDKQTRQHVPASGYFNYVR